ncbi:MAG: phosphoribosyltransferase [bacterium]|nr:phosphoribosyltransferase [bacterium]
MKKQKYTWQEFGEDIPKLVAKIKKLNRRFDGIYGVPRGGLPIAVALSHRLNLPLLIGGVNSKTLLVDDIADTGSTLLPYADRKATIVTLFWHPKSKVKPHVWLRKKETDWILFPWEKN